MARLLVVLAAVAAVLALPSAAAAHHVAATASIDATMGPILKSGMREMTVHWNAACGVPDAEVVVTVARVIQPKNRSLDPVAIDGAEAYEQGAGSAQIQVSPGSRFAPVIEVACSALAEDGTSHSSAASATGPEFRLPPRLRAVRIVSGTICGYEPTRRAMRSLQAGQTHTVEPDLLFNGLSMLRRPRGTKGITLRIRGVGVNARVRGRAADGIFGFALPRPRRAGRAKVWFVFDGTPTNKLSLRVLADRC